MHSSGQNAPHYCVLLTIPGGFSCGNVIAMPANGVDAATFVHFANHAFHVAEINGVEVIFGANFDVTNFPARYSRILSGNVFHIRAVFFAVPAVSVCGVVLMSEHYAFIHQFQHAFVKRHSLR